MVEIMDVYKSLNISTGTEMKNPEMVYSCLLRYVPDQYKTQ